MAAASTRRASEARPRRAPVQSACCDIDAVSRIGVDGSQTRTNNSTHKKDPHAPQPNSIPTLIARSAAIFLTLDTRRHRTMTKTCRASCSFHGGGMGAGSIDSLPHRRALAETTGCRLISGRLSAGARASFPPLRGGGCLSRRTEFVSRPCRVRLGMLPTKRVGVDSAGQPAPRGVASTAGQRRACHHGAMPDLSLVLDFEMTSPSLDGVCRELPDQPPHQLEADLADDRGGIAPASMVLPAAGNKLTVTGLPAAIIHTADSDYQVRDEGNAYATSCWRGFTSSTFAHDCMIHNFHAMGCNLAQAR